MRSLHLVLAAAFVGACSIGACSSDSSAPSDAFVTEYCSLTAHCCTAANEQNASECTSSFKAFVALFGDKYDATRGNACLDKLRAAQMCDFSAASATCENVFGTKGGAAAGTKNPGEACTSSSECATSPDGPVTCKYSSVQGPNGSSTYEQCQVEAKGVVGGPCEGTLELDGSRSYAGGYPMGVPPPVTHFCDRAGGATCDGATSTCVALIADGSPCVDGYDRCQSQFCGNDGNCAPRVPLGGTCSQILPCVSGAFCKSGTCAAKGPAGAPCSATDNNACLGFCDFEKNVCIASGIDNSSPPLGCFSKGK